MQKITFTCILLVFNFFTVLAQTQALSIGEIRTLHSTALNEDRTLNIYLPLGYDTAQTYPVLYLLDGSMDEDFIHIVGLTQFFNMMYTMPPCIVVGIANVDRKRDFTFPTEIPSLKEKYPTTGKSAVFIRFLEEELQPFIQKNYRTNDTKYLIGQSLGGLLATEILLKKAALFTHYFIVSPSLWWDEESLLKQAPTLLTQQPDTQRFVYVSVGEKEDKIMQREAQALHSILEKSGKKNLKTVYKPMANDNHATVLHNSIYAGFMALFPPRYDE
jgi:predicted alpha/beta superfamily hydrolase